MTPSQMFEGGEHMLDMPALRRRELLRLRDGSHAAWCGKDVRPDELAIWNFQLRQGVTGQQNAESPCGRRVRAKRPRQTLRQRVAEILRRNGEWTRG